MSPTDQLVSLQQRLQSYVESSRPLPGELADLTQGLQHSADLLSHVIEFNPPTRAR